jgi:hypothetical protein
MFGQPSLRAKWKQALGSVADIRGLSVDEHVARLREQLMPLIERFHNGGVRQSQMARKQILLPRQQLSELVAGLGEL